MIIIETQNLILRDMITEDLSNRLKWEMEETEWKQWDAPWEYDNLTEEDAALEVREYMDFLKKSIDGISLKSNMDIRYSFQIVEKSSANYIGWVNAYDIDEEYNFTDHDCLLAIGIDIPDQSARGKGYGKEAIEAVMDYYFNHGYEKIYTQTWSGNERMVHLATILGFKLVGRKEGIRIVRGNIYDGLTFEMQKIEI